MPKFNKNMRERKDLKEYNVQTAANIIAGTHWNWSRIRPHHSSFQPHEEVSGIHERGRDTVHSVETFLQEENISIHKDGEDTIPSIEIFLREARTEALQDVLLAPEEPFYLTDIQNNANDPKITDFEDNLV